jgi:hypothetical protein
MTKLLVLYYSMYGHVETMAKYIAEGARSVDGVEVTLKHVPELVPEEVARKHGAKVDQAAPIASPKIAQGITKSGLKRAPDLSGELKPGGSFPPAASSACWPDAKTDRRRNRHSILPRIGQTRRQPETRDVHRPAGSGNQRGDARVRFLEIEEQQHAPGDRRVAVIKPVLAQQKQFRFFERHLPAQRFRRHVRQHREQMWRVIRLGSIQKPCITGEFFQEIIQRQLVVGGMQHPLAQNAEMMREVLGCGVHVVTSRL